MAHLLHFNDCMKITTDPETPTRIKMTETAFLQAAERESKKNTRERLIEQTQAPFYFLKGAAKSSLKLLEKGLQGKLSSWREQIETFSSPKKYFATQAKKQEAFRTTAKGIYQDPKKFLIHISEGFKDELTQKTVAFLNSPKKKQAEQIGEWAAPLAFFFVGGELGNLARISRARNLPINSLTKLPEGIQLAYDKTTKTWTRSIGFKYALDKNFGTTLKHLLHHAKPPPPGKKKHTIFNVSKRELLPLIDEAWTKREKPLPGDKGAYLVDMGRIIGRNGETSIKIIVKEGTHEIITAYPFDVRKTWK